MLKYYGAPEAFDETKKWYDGYRFGNEDIYCPWDVINHCKALKVDERSNPTAILDQYKWKLHYQTVYRKMRINRQEEKSSN